MFPFMNLVVKLTCKIIPGKDSEEGKYELQFIGKEGMIRPTTAVPNAIQEICHMANIAKENLSRSLDAFWNLDNKEVEKVYQVEEQINYMNQAITDYLVKINEMVLPAQGCGDHRRIVPRGQRRGAYRRSCRKLCGGCENGGRKTADFQ